MVPRVGCEVKRGFFFKMGEITACLHVDGNDTATVYKALISRISVINIDSGKRW